MVNQIFAYYASACIDDQIVTTSYDPCDPVNI